MEIITTHINAEFDSFASMVAAQRLYPEALIVFPGAQEKNLRHFLERYPHHCSFRRLKSIRLDRVKKLILVDTRRSDRIAGLAAILGRKDLEVHIYDHHPPSPNDIQGSREVIRDVGANITILVELLRKQGLEITPLEATIFALGIYEDTGSLTFISTTPDDLRAAGYLLERGADLRVVSDYITRELTPEQVSLLNDLLESRLFVDVEGLKITIATAVRDRFVGDLAMVAHKIKDIENLNVLFVLVRMKDRIHLVARSRLEAIDAGEIAEAMGGGGHPTAASAVIREQDTEKVKETLIAVLREKVKPVYLVRHLMSSPVKSIESDVNIGEALEIMSHLSINHLPILQNGSLTGIVHREDLGKALRHGLGDKPVGEFMSDDYEALSPEDPHFRIQELILNRGHSFLPVMENGRLVGGVTRSDLLGLLRHEADLKPTYRDGGEDSIHFRASRNVAGLMEERLPPDVVGMIRTLGEVAQQMGVTAHLVGGFVRDLLLHKPNLDLDLVVEGNGIAFARAGARRLGGRVRSHKKFETAVIILPDGFKVDVATARMEYYEYPGALPKIEHGSIKMDLYRRDFTINALAVQLSGENQGRLLDFFGGQRDLESGHIRVIHDLSFVDDPTRVFRAVRFEQRLDFNIGEHTLKLIGKAVEHQLIESIVPSRLLGELKGILREEYPLPALERLWELDLHKAIHPALGGTPLKIPAMRRLIEVTGRYRGRVEEDFQEWLIFLAGLVRPLKKREMKELKVRLGLSPAEFRLLERIDAGQKELGKVLGDEDLLGSEAHRAAAAFPLEVVFFTLAVTRDRNVAARLREHLEQRGRLEPYLTGKDLQGMGYPPGPLYRKILDALLDAQINGEVRDRRRTRTWVRKKFPLKDNGALKERR